MNRRVAFVMMCSLIVMILLLFFIPKLGQRDELNFLCDHHSEFYHRKIVGTVVDHYVDSADHARRTVVIRDNRGMDYEIWFISYSNWRDFDKIKVQDSITKDADSFAYTVNGELIVIMQFDCNY